MGTSIAKLAAIAPAAPLSLWLQAHGCVLPPASFSSRSTPLKPRRQTCPRHRHVENGQIRLISLCLWHRTRDYMDISLYNPPETSTVDVAISPLLGGYIWQCGGIRAQAGILSLKL